MVLNYYKLTENPFGVTPDPRYLYFSTVHREALATLSCGIQSRRGAMSLIAEPGMGKTTILFQLLSQLEGSARTAFLFQTLCSPKDLLRGLLHDLGIGEDQTDAVGMQEQLTQLLVAEARQGRTVVVVIDEAQNLEDSALELVRMLSNFETSSYKLMQIILVGQPQLRDKLASPQLHQLRQRMSIFARLHPLSVEETHCYIHHRLRVAGYDFKTPLFNRKAEALIARYSEGIPRNINNICFNALSLGCVLKQQTIREEVVRETLDDLEIEADDTNGLQREPAGRKLVAASRSHAITELRRPVAWLRGLAVCVIVLLQLLCLSDNRQTPESLRRHSAVFGTTSQQMETMQLNSALGMDRPSSTDSSVNDEGQPDKMAPWDLRR